MAKNCDALGLPVGHMVSFQNSTWLQFGSAAAIWIQWVVYASIVDFKTGWGCIFNCASTFESSVRRRSMMEHFFILVSVICLNFLASDNQPGSVATENRPDLSESEVETKPRMFANLSCVGSVGFGVRRLFLWRGNVL